jgi:hypothetical protein
MDTDQQMSSHRGHSSSSEHGGIDAGAKCSMKASNSTSVSNNIPVNDCDDTSDQIQYWKNKAMQAIHHNRTLAGDQERLQDDLGIANRRVKRLEWRKKQLRDEFESWEAKIQSRRSSLTGAHTGNSSFARETDVEKRNRQIKSMLGTSIRSKWAAQSISDRDMGFAERRREIRGSE